MRSEAPPPPLHRRPAWLSRPGPLAALLALCTAIPVLMAAARVVQIPAGTLPEDSLRLATAPVAYFAHALGGLLFGLLGPLQFVRALRHRYGTAHRWAGRVFAIAGLGLGLSGLAMLLQVQSITTALLDTARGGFGLALIAALALGVAAARAHDLPRHRAWMIRAYAIGMGTGPAGLVLFPVYLVSGEPVAGLGTDAVVVGLWLVSIGVGEGVVRGVARPETMQAPTG